MTWWVLFFVDLLFPILMIVTGRLMYKHTPKSVNGLIGYRTSCSMKNIDTWNFAHDYCGRLWLKIGWIILILSIIVQIPFYNDTDGTAGTISMILVIVQLVLLVGTIIPTEKALKKNFNDDGTKKEN